MSPASNGDPDWIEFFFPKFWNPLDCNMFYSSRDEFLLINIFEDGLKLMIPGFEEYCWFTPLQFELDEYCCWIPFNGDFGPNISSLSFNLGFESIVCLEGDFGSKLFDIGTFSLLKIRFNKGDCVLLGNLDVMGVEFNPDAPWSLARIGV